MFIFNWTLGLNKIRVSVRRHSNGSSGLPLNPFTKPTCHRSEGTHLSFGPVVTPRFWSVLENYEIRTPRNGGA